MGTPPHSRHRWASTLSDLHVPPQYQQRAPLDMAESHYAAAIPAFTELHVLFKQSSVQLSV